MFGLRKPKIDPVREFIDDWKPHMFTPDYAWLETKMYQIVFLYNQIMTGHPKHNEFIIEGTGMLGTAFTQEGCYEMFIKNLGEESFPIVVEDRRKEEPGIWFKTVSTDPLVRNVHAVNRGPHPFATRLGRIKGELYAFKPNQLLGLDKYLQNGIEFRRTRVKTVIFYFKHDKVNDTWQKAAYIVRAWMYIGLPEYWDDLLDAGFLFSKGPKFAAPTNYAKLADYYFYGPKQVNK